MERLQIWRIIELWIQCRMILHIWSLLILLHWHLTDLAVNHSYVPTSNKCDTQCIIHCSLCIQRFASCTLHHFTSLQKTNIGTKTSQTEDPVQNNAHLHFTDSPDIYSLQLLFDSTHFSDSPDIYPSATQTGARLCTSQPEEQVNPLPCRSQHHHPHSSSASSVCIHVEKNSYAPSIDSAPSI